MKTAKQLVDEAMQQIVTLALPEAQALLIDADALFVDLRDVRELEREGVIPGAFHAPRGLLEFWVDPQSAIALAIARGLPVESAAFHLCHHAPLPLRKNFSSPTVLKSPSASCARRRNWG